MHCLPETNLPPAYAKIGFSYSVPMLQRISDMVLEELTN